MTLKTADTVLDLLKIQGSMDDAAFSNIAKHDVKIESLQHGDYFLSRRPEFGITIYGEVVTEASDASDKRTMDHLRARGYVFGKCFSEECPQGELGDTHITVITRKISREDFLKAKAAGFAFNG